MTASCLIGIDFGSDSARGVLIDTASGAQLGSCVRRYAHGTLTTALPSGAALPAGFALQVATDYLEAAETILSALGRDREIAGIGIDFTASSPLPATADGTPLSTLRPGEPHAYVKLWKHGAAQAYAEAITAKGGDFLRNFGGRLSGEWLLAKAAQIVAEAPEVWAATERFIEAGDWLVWQLTGREARSLDFAAFKAQYQDGAGYPASTVPGLAARLGDPVPVGTAAGPLADVWRSKTGIRGDAIVAAAVIDSHAVLPAVGAVEDGTLVGALGTSAAFLLLERQVRDLPTGIEGVAYGAALPALWCFEAGQAGFGDTLSWFVRRFPNGDDAAASFTAYNAEAARLEPGQGGLVALDWWGGNRVPYGDVRLGGLIAGLTLATSAAEIYRALLEALSFGARSVLDLFEEGGVPVGRIILTSGLARANPVLVQIIADVFGRPIEVPDIDNPTAVGAAIHGAVASRRVADFGEGAGRYGARTATRYAPDHARHRVYGTLYRQYRALAGNPAVRDALRVLHGVRAGDFGTVSAGRGPAGRI